VVSNPDVPFAAHPRPDHYPAAEASRDGGRMPAGVPAISHQRGESAGMPLAFAVERSFMVVRARLWNFGGVIGEGFR
jgi:hypothetical protein